MKINKKIPRLCARPSLCLALLALLALLLHGGLRAPCALAAATQNTPAQSDKIKEAVRRFGTGEKARVKVTLHNRTKLNGYLRDTGADAFTVVDQANGQAVTVAYGDVQRIQGRNLSTGAKIAIGAGIAVGVLLVLVLIGLHYAD